MSNDKYCFWTADSRFICPFTPTAFPNIFNNKQQFVQTIPELEPFNKQKPFHDRYCFSATNGNYTCPFTPNPINVFSFNNYQTKPLPESIRTGNYRSIEHFDPPVTKQTSQNKMTLQQNASKQQSPGKAGDALYTSHPKTTITPLPTLTPQCPKDKELWGGLCYPMTCINEGGKRISACSCDTGNPDTQTDCIKFNGATKDCPPGYDKVGSCTCQKTGGVKTDCSKYGNAEFPIQQTYITQLQPPATSFPPQIIKHAPIQRQPLIDFNLQQLPGNIKSGLNNDYCINLMYGAVENNARIDLWKCDGTDKQKWTYNMADQTMKYNLNPRFCMSINDASPGDKPILKPCDGSVNQKWIQDGTRFKPVLNPNNCINLNANDLRNDADITIQKCDPSAQNQEWIFDRLSANGDVKFAVAQQFDDFQKTYPSCERDCGCTAANLLLRDAVASGQLTKGEGDRIWQEGGFLSRCKR